MKNLPERIAVISVVEVGLDFSTFSLIQVLKSNFRGTSNTPVRVEILNHVVLDGWDDSILLQ